MDVEVLKAEAARLGLTAKSTGCAAFPLVCVEGKTARGELMRAVVKPMPIGQDRLLRARPVVFRRESMCQPVFGSVAAAVNEASIVEAVAAQFMALAA